MNFPSFHKGNIYDLFHIYIYIDVSLFHRLTFFKLLKKMFDNES
jgi:hypothetical protein